MATMNRYRSMFTMYASALNPDHRVPAQPDHLGPVGDDGPGHHVRPVTLGGSGRQLPDHPTGLLHGHSLGHRLLGLLSVSLVQSSGPIHRGG